MHYIRKIDFKDFANLMIVALIITTVIAVLYVLAGSYITFDNQNQRINEQNFYWLLQGKQVNDTRMAEITRIAQQIYEGEFQNWSRVAEIDSDKEIDLNYAFALWDKVVSILENPETEVTVEMPDWEAWFLFAAKISYLIFALGLSIGYAGSTKLDYYYSRDRPTNKWWQYPWKKWWAYPILLVMIPYVIATQPAVAIYALFRKLKGIDRREEERQMEQRLRKESAYPRLISEEKIETRKVRFQSLVALIKKGHPKTRNDWIKHCRLERLTLEKQEIESEIRQIRLDLSSFGKKIETSQRNLASANSELKVVERAIKSRTLEGKTDKALGIEFDQLLEVPLIEAIEIKGKEIRVFTDTISLRYKGKKYEIGNFLIRIGTDKKGYIKIENLCNTSNCGRHHPYSDDGSSTKFCFGNISGDIKQLLKEKNYEPLIIVILQALQTAEGDHPERIERWKGVKT